jgi:hypothetical protein
MMLGASESLSLNREAVVTWMSMSFSMSMEVTSAGFAEACCEEDCCANPQAAKRKNIAALAVARSLFASMIKAAPSTKIIFFSR